MYDPNEAKKSYVTLLKQNGGTAAIQSLFVVIAMYFFNKYMIQQPTPVFVLVVAYLFFCIYHTWKPKLIRFLRGHLRGAEYRDRAD